jgi:uracil-DNA glycosylase
MKYREPTLEILVNEILKCRICSDFPKGKPLPHDPRPVLVPSSTARVLIVGQAPGTRVHASGRPFTDPSGDRLRVWLGIGPETFYDPARVAILPMGFCFPGLSPKGSDLPPRPECASAWRNRLMAAMPQIELVVGLGTHALRWHMAEKFKGNLDQTVVCWREGLALKPMVFPLPHPSWRNNAWLKRNPWFETELLPVLRREVARRL